MKNKILFIQLPMLDNDTLGQRENFPFAGLWLSHALSQHPEGEFWEVATAPAEWDELDNAHLIQKVLASGVSAVAFTLCLWNVERAMRLARQLRELPPNLFLMAGGPEVSEDHPFLLEPCFDALVTGEGEAVFPELLKGLRIGKMPAYDNVFLSVSEGWKRGSKSPPQIDLASAQIPVEMLKPCIQTRPSVYIETSRGCPLSCTYCRYHHLQKGVRALPADAAAVRIQQLRDAGAKEIRFVDPTFNARADFTRLLELLVKINPDRKLGFFAELRADTLTSEQADLLAQTNFLDIEVGVQSTDPNVLRAIRRPANIAQVERGIRLLTGAGVHVTLDLMYGLPKQTLGDVLSSIEWARSLGGNISIQCMQTLLLPGTDLRDQAEQYGITAMARPPYGVVSTSTLSEGEITQIETMLHDSDDLPADPVTPRFTGYWLSGLFSEQEGKNRRALMIRGKDLNARRKEICQQIEQSVANEPDMLWQFVLCPENEEPLELLETMIHTIRKQPPHLLDRYASAELSGLIASRRILVRLKRGREYDEVWHGQVEELLGSHFA
ncbi:MAG: radical SAM protein [Kiritimatiellales bacterium]|nr:radical SAM protein [Kiritimatiellales bacterium]